MPPLTDKLNLSPTFDEVATAIRTVDTTKLIFYGTVTWEILGVGGFDHVPGGAHWANKTVLSYHNSVWDKGVPDDPTYYHNRRAEAQRLGAITMVTETVRQDLFDFSDQLSVSWLRWGYKAYSNWTWDNNGLFAQSADGHQPCSDRTNMTACLLVDQVKVYARVYPFAVAGDVVSFAFNASTLVATLIYMPDLTCTLPTEVFIPEKWHYPQGYTFVVTPASVRVTQLPNFLHLAAVDRQNVTLSIHPQ